MPVPGPQPEDNHEEFDERRAKMVRLRAEGIDPYPPVTLWADRTRIADVLAAHDPAELEPGEHPELRYHIAGRLISRRGHGKTAFLDVRDLSGSIQAVVRVDALGEETYERILNLDIGDIVGIEGCVYVTQRGQLALAVIECTLLTKALRPPPDKHHGLGDTGTRYRYRELDLIANEETRELFITRYQIVYAIREWLNERNFIEVETPALQSLAGGAGSRPFTTHHNALDRDLYLRISVELFLNRCIVGGMENVYDMGKVFRNEGISPKHSPEFTIIEFMMAYADYNDVATATEEMFRDVAQRVLHRTVIKRNSPSRGGGLRCASSSSSGPAWTSWSPLAISWPRCSISRSMSRRHGRSSCPTSTRARSSTRSTSPRMSSTSRSSPSPSPSATPCTPSSGSTSTP
jgi:lysyl-tRNA synthetase class 2